MTVTKNHISGKNGNISVSHLRNLLFMINEKDYK